MNQRPLPPAIAAAIVLIAVGAVGCSSISICVEQERGVSASEDARAAYRAVSASRATAGAR
jgi:hypothetical protein